MRRARICAEGVGSSHCLSRIIQRQMLLGKVEDPKDYRYCGYGEAVGGASDERDGLSVVLADVVAGGDWRQVSRVYRQTLFEWGVATPEQAGISPEKVRAVVSGDGELSRSELLRCRVRYFSDGVVLGSRAFVDGVFASHREQFGVKRKTGARAMRYGDWGGLCTMRDLRQTVDQRLRVESAFSPRRRPLRGRMSASALPVRSPAPLARLGRRQTGHARSDSRGRASFCFCISLQASCR